MTASSNSDESGVVSYDHDQNTNVDSTRGNLLTDVQMSAETVPMPSSSKQMALNDTTRHEIATILERPVNLGTYEWSTTDEPIPVQLPYSDYIADTQNFMQKLDFPQAIFKNSPIVVDKLKNYQYFKADIEIEVKINAQPFLQGALMLVYNPYYDQTGDFRRKGTRFLASQTSCPYKIVSIEEGNSLKLICPYANIYDMFDLSNSDNQFGTVFLYTFSKLVGPESPVTAKYTVFARFVNPQFFVPTHKDVISSARDSFEIRRLKARGYYVAQSDVQPAAAKDTGEVEVAGPVSKIAGGVSMVADVLSCVPVIGNVASTVAWVSRAIGKTAATLGWSKPTSIQPQTKSVLKPAQTLIHTEGHDDATTLALIQDNGIDGSSFIPETKDEMSLAYIFGRPNYFHRQEVPASMFAKRQLITAWEVSPFSRYQHDDAGNLFLGSFAFSSMMGTLWRGTIHYDIMVIKTPYHQGRFAVVFLPETNWIDVPKSLGELLNTNYSVVCNLKDRQDEMGRTTFRVSIPFISNTGWRETYKTNEGTGYPNTTTLDTKTGCVAIYSLVDLSHPPTVADSITMYIAHSGGDDYQISRPQCQIGPGYVDWAGDPEPEKYPATVSEMEEDVVDRTGTFHAQSDFGSVFVPEDENLLVPSHTQKDITAQTTGEYFNSLRAIVKRFGLVCKLAQTPLYAGFRTRHMTENTKRGSRVITTAKGQDQNALVTPWYLTSFLYRFYNGSSQLKVLPATADMVAEAFVSFDEYGDCMKIAEPYISHGKPIFQQNQQVSNAFEIRTPYYRGVRCDVINTNQQPVLGDVRTNVRCQQQTVTNSGLITSNMYEAAGDDFNYFFLIGPPPMQDIRNSNISVFPFGVNVVLDLSNITTFIVGDPVTYVIDQAICVNNPLPPGKYAISFSDPFYVPIAMNDGTVVSEPFTSFYWDNEKSELVLENFDKDFKDIDLTRSQAFTRFLSTVVLTIPVVPT